MACCFFHQSCSQDELAEWTAEFEAMPAQERCVDCPGAPTDDRDLLTGGE